MRRHILLLFIFMLGTTTLVAAQEDIPPSYPAVDGEPIRIRRGELSPPIFGPLTGIWSPTVPVEAQRVQEPVTTQGIAADFCADAPELGMQTFGTAGDESIVNNMTTSIDDPILACTYGAPKDRRGFRTVWYKFVAPESGRLIVNTGFDPSDFVDSYDTVLALYRSEDGTCGTLNMLACNDDHEGFLSQVSHFVTQGLTYYIEVADWHFDSQGPDTLRLAVVLEQGESFWGQLSQFREEARSRHMVVTDGRYIYVIAGEEAVSEFPERDEMVRRFDPETETFTQLLPMPRPSYSRTSAAYLNGRIYVPSGYTGNNAQDDNTHWVYDIATDIWFENVARMPGDPYAWHEAVSWPAGNSYFVTGGLVSGDPDPSGGSDAVPTARLQMFTPDPSGRDGFWNPNFPDMNVARYAHVAALLETSQASKVCVAGGLGRNQNNQLILLRSAECYNIASATWSSIASLNFPRFSAGSAVGPDGRWYVFGGVNNELQPVTVTEVYDPHSNTWQVLDSRYGLRNPGRAWPRGAFVGSTLWVFYGEQVPGNEIVPLIEKLYIPINTWLPHLQKPGTRPVITDDRFGQARPIALDQPQEHHFDTHEDFFDFYRFEVQEPGIYRVDITNIPSERDYDVYVYDSNKLLVGDSQNVGNLSESAFTQPLTPGVYYVMVLRAFGQPTTDTYRILVTRDR